ncbi:MAG: hypothetical protein R2852_09650 [Bacteroidia bacterium]
MKKITIVSILVGFLVLLGSCKKTETNTIIQEYNPPKATLFGTWKVITAGSNDQYYVFQDDGSNLYYILTEDQNGFRTMGDAAFSATVNQVYLQYVLYNYWLSNDTLTFASSSSNMMKFMRVDSPKFTPMTWMGSTMIDRNLAPPRGFSSTNLSFGIQGDFLYPYSVNSGSSYIYQYNTLTEKYVDSLGVSKPATSYFNSGDLYVGFNGGTFNIYKGNMASISSISSNTISNVLAVSLNSSSGVIYAFNSQRRMYTGLANSSFSELFDFSTYGVNTVVYYKNDEFLCVKNNRIYRIKISPSFEVLESYNAPSGVSYYTISTNGTDVWAYGYDSNYSSNRLMKVKF